MWKFYLRQTPSCLDRFTITTITKEGRLLLHKVRYEEAAEPRDGFPFAGMTAIPMGDVDTEFHGDLLLVSTVKGRLVEYVARFAHGTLEWIRPLSELSELQRTLLF